MENLLAEMVESAIDQARSLDTIPSVDQVFRPEDWVVPTREVAAESIGKLMVAGVELESEAVEKGVWSDWSKDGIDDIGLDQLLTELPPEVAAEVQAELGQALGQSHWRSLPRGVRDDLASVLGQSIEAGESASQAVERLRETMPDLNKIRALRIARTETTGALNAGQQVTRNRLARQGLVTKKEWIATLDGSTRQTHTDSNGQQVEATGLFTLGNQTARFPGDFSLSGEERANCRCVSVSITVVEDPDVSDEVVDELIGLPQAGA